MDEGYLFEREECPNDPHPKYFYPNGIECPLCGFRRYGD